MPQRGKYVLDNSNLHMRATEGSNWERDKDHSATARGEMKR